MPEQARDGFPDRPTVDQTRWRVTRREVIKQGGAVGALVVLPTGLLEDHREPAVIHRQFFSAEQVRTVEAVTARLIPSDSNGPGAQEALVWRYIDRLLVGPMNTYHGPTNPSSTLQKAYTAGLAALDAYATKTRGSAFADLSPTDQDAVLSAMEMNEATGFTPNSKAFFSLIRQHTIEGMFGDPYYGGNASFAGWNLIGFPGISLMYSREEQKLGVTVPKAHKSVTQIGFFGKDREGM